MKYVCPLIVVSDIEHSRNFYEKILNQKVKFDFGENITFHGDFAIHLDTHFRKLIDGKPIVKGSNSFELYFEYDAVEQLVDVLEKHKVTFVHQLREQPWRQQVVRFYDPDDHIVEVGESLNHTVLRLHREGLTKVKIAEAMGMGIDFVEMVLQ